MVKQSESQKHTNSSLGVKMTFAIDFFDDPSIDTTNSYPTTVQRSVWMHTQARKSGPKQRDQTLLLLFWIRPFWDKDGQSSNSHLLSEFVTQPTSG